LAVLQVTRDIASQAEDYFPDFDITGFEDNKNLTSIFISKILQAAGVESVKEEEATQGGDQDPKHSNDQMKKKQTSEPVMHIQSCPEPMVTPEQLGIEVVQRHENGKSFIVAS